MRVLYVVLALAVVLAWSGAEASKKKKNKDRAGHGDAEMHRSEHERAEVAGIVEDESSSEEDEDKDKVKEAAEKKTQRFRRFRHYYDPYNLDHFHSGLRSRREEKLGRNKELGELGPQGSKDETWKDISAKMKDHQVSTPGPVAVHRRRRGVRRRRSQFRRQHNPILHEMHYQNRQENM